MSSLSVERERRSSNYVLDAVCNPAELTTLGIIFRFERERYAIVCVVPHLVKVYPSVERGTCCPIPVAVLVYSEVIVGPDRGLSIDGSMQLAPRRWFEMYTEEFRLYTTESETTLFLLVPLLRRTLIVKTGKNSEDTMGPHHLSAANSVILTCRRNGQAASDDPSTPPLVSSSARHTQGCRG